MRDNPELNKIIASLTALGRVGKPDDIGGAVATDFNGGHVRDNPELNKMVASLTALGRVGQPDDIGGAIASLLCGETKWITGQRIEVSGGQGL